MKVCASLTDSDGLPRSTSMLAFNVAQARFQPLRRNTSGQAVSASERFHLPTPRSSLKRSLTISCKIVSLTSGPLDQRHVECVGSEVSLSTIMPTVRCR